MAVDLTEDQINELCMFMRVIDVLKSRMDLVEENPELKKQYEAVCQQVKVITDFLSEEQFDYVLEVHKIQSQEVNRKVERDRIKREKKEALKKKNS